jgi:hypothetical protein
MLYNYLFKSVLSDIALFNLYILYRYKKLLYSVFINCSAADHESHVYPLNLLNLQV